MGLLRWVKHLTLFRRASCMFCLPAFLPSYLQTPVVTWRRLWGGQASAPSSR